jgi:hypothetical protein
MVEMMKDEGKMVMMAFEKDQSAFEPLMDSNCFDMDVQE